MKTIRIAVDIDVEQGDADEIAKAVFAGRGAIGNFALDVIARNDDNVDTSQLQAHAVAGAAHVHSVEDGSYCGMCDKYSRRVHLVEND